MRAAIDGDNQCESPRVLDIVSYVRLGNAGGVPGHAPSIMFIYPLDSCVLCGHTKGRITRMCRSRPLEVGEEITCLYQSPKAGELSTMAVDGSKLPANRSTWLSAAT